jgi:hypothetical protein
MTQSLLTEDVREQYRGKTVHSGNIKICYGLQLNLKTDCGLQVELMTLICDWPQRNLRLANTSTPHVDRPQPKSYIHR